MLPIEVYIYFGCIRCMEILLAMFEERKISLDAFAYNATVMPSHSTHKLLTNLSYHLFPTQHTTTTTTKNNIKYLLMELGGLRGLRVEC